MRHFAVILSLLLLGIVQRSPAQELAVMQITIKGAVRTKEVTILRELDFAVGDSIPQEQITARFERNRSNLLNTALFTDVQLNISEWDTRTHQIDVTITVKEAWYLYVVPILELADRNFNVWWQEHNASFNRLNLGVNMIHINLTGIRDKLKVKGQLGYTRKFEMNYELPYFNQEKTMGIFFNAFFSANKEVAYLSEGNKEVFYHDDNSDVFRRFRLQAGLRYRPDLYFTHEVEISFHNNWIAPQVALDDNPDFFLNRRSRQEFIGLRYTGEFDKRNLQLFPTRGFLGGVEIVKNGIGAFGDINNLSVSPYFEYYYPISNRISAGIQGKGMYNVIRNKQPFWNYNALGYGQNYLRGYELYVINGMDFLYGKGCLRGRIFSAQFNWNRKMPAAFREMPIQVYGTMNYDVGYVNDPFYYNGNPLVNRTISGWGPGLAVILYHTFAVHIEYNFNDRGENGMYLHTKTSF